MSSAAILSAIPLRTSDLVFSWQPNLCTGELETDSGLAFILIIVFVA
jgi:hypothetical protein